MVEILLRTLERHSSRRKHEPDQIIHIFLAALLVVTIFADRWSNCYFHYLVKLTTFDVIPRYNWVSAGLATLFCHLRAAPRKADKTQGDMEQFHLSWRSMEGGRGMLLLFLDSSCVLLIFHDFNYGFYVLVQPWFYSYFPHLAPGANALVLFRAVLSWGKAHAEKWRFETKDLKFRGVLDTLLMVQGVCYLFFS